MSTKWETVHRRTALLNDVVGQLDAGRTDLPWTDDLAAEFENPDALLVALHDVWTRGLEGRIHLGLEMDDEGDLAAAVADAWRYTAERLPGVRRILDVNATAAVLRHAERAEHQMIAVAAGLAAFGDPVTRSVRLGQSFVTGLRAQAPSVRRGKRRPLMTRIKEALAA